MREVMEGTGTSLRNLIRKSEGLRLWDLYLSQIGSAAEMIDWVREEMEIYRTESR